jgi:hypothetical protein
MTSESALGVRRQQRSETKAAERYLCFGPFQVDLQREELFKEGSRVRIPSKGFQVLLALVPTARRNCDPRGVARAAVARRRVCELGRQRKYHRK